MTVSERLVPFGYSLHNLSLLTDGSVANFAMFWSTATPRTSENQNDFPIKLRNPRIYSSQLTQYNSVPKTHSMQGKINNWVYLNKRVLPKLGIQLSDETINNLVKADRNTMIGFFDMMFNALQKVTNGQIVLPVANEEEKQVSKIEDVLSRSELVMDPKSATVVKQSINLSRTAKDQNEYTQKLSYNKYESPSRLNYRQNECQKCAIYEKKIRLLEEEIDFLRKKITEK
ncbi:CH-like_domain in sperm protein [Hexamita inflata]|uniref:CH-like domain in sperm protein n=1 Tax=Hexamita inflata TaxID=28002 RepID=A0AA86NM53_9EUKA|nr:CH-like domain in sperm protein [Hexamita inflata]CAI9950255.1 CH-like domain in sperm protein [Hexamita inflata]